MPFPFCARSRHRNRQTVSSAKGGETFPFGMNPRPGSPSRALFFVLAPHRYGDRTISSPREISFISLGGLACSLWGFCRASPSQALSSLQILVQRDAYELRSALRYPRIFQMLTVYSQRVADVPEKTG